MKKLKDILKDKRDASTSGITDPGQLGQYSATNLTKESSGLDSYLSSKGINPKFISRNTKIGHSKSTEFQKWKKDHMNEDMAKGKSAGDARSKEVDSPTAQRQNELKKASNHNTIKPVHAAPMMKKEGSQTTAITPESVQIDELSAKKLYDYIDKASKDPKHDKGVIKATGKYLKTQEEVDMVNEDTQVHGQRHYVLSPRDGDYRVFHQYHSYTQKADGSKSGWSSSDQQVTDKQEHRHGGVVQVGNIVKHKTAAEAHAKAAKLNHEAGIPNPTHTHRINDKIISKSKIYHGMDSHPSTHEYVEPPKNVKEEFEEINEISKKTLGSYVKAAHQDVVDRASSSSFKSGAAGDKYNKADDSAKEIHRKVGIQKAITRLSKEDTLDPKAATQSSADGTTLGDADDWRNKLSKTARRIKEIYKSKRVVKEELYDHEKADKSVETYGKKPKHEKGDDKDSKGEKKPQAAAIVTGGTTLTGETRDDIEIDPMMRNRPGQPDVTKKDDKKKDDKKEEKK